jgi:hypothetical protein
MWRTILLLGFVLLLAGCFGGSDSASVQSAAAKPSHGVADGGWASKTRRDCPVTLPNSRTPPGQSDIGANHGNDKIWTTMWPYNVVIATPHYTESDGSVGMKWPWWWKGIRGRLHITGHRLDAQAAPLSASIQPGYQNFQPSGIHFPTEGCWEVTGRVGSAELTFVTLVLRASRYWPVPRG